MITSGPRATNFPAALFANGEQGVQFDCDDYNSTTYAWRRNLLTYTQDFSNAAWSKTNASLQSNLLTYSQDFDNAVWGKGAPIVSITPNTAAAPDGTSTADSIFPTAGSNNHFIYNLSVVSLQAVARTFSVYVKYGNHRWVALQSYDGTSSWVASFDLLNGVVGSKTASASSSIEALASGWYRLSITVTGVAGNSTFYIGLNDVDATTLRVWTAAGTEYAYLWGAQIELGSTANTYRATGSASLPILFTAPDGTLTAMKLVESTATAPLHGASQNFSGVIPGSTCSISAYAKAGERNFLYLYYYSSTPTQSRVVFDLSNGTVSYSDALSSAITSVGDGWYRCSFNHVVGGPGGATQVAAFVQSSGTTDSYAGNGTSGIYFWGAQLEKAPAASAYQPLTDVSTQFLAAFPNYSMFQENTGATASWTVEQTVGLNLDKHLGLNLGTELVTNGDFSNGTTGWTGYGTGGVFSVVGGEYQINSASASQSCGSYQDLTVIPATYYRITASGRILSGSGSDLARIWVYDGAAFTTLLSTIMAVTTVGVMTTYSFLVKSGASTTMRVAMFSAIGNISRFDNFSTKVSLGNHATQATAANRPILRSRYNLLTYSEQFDNAAWSTSGTITKSANAAVAPDGTMTADLLTTTATNAFLYQQPTVVLNATCTLSWYLKNNNSTQTEIKIRLASSAIDFYLNWSGATLTDISYGLGAATFAAVGNGWYRVQATFVAIETNGYVRILPDTLVGTNSVYAWGADLRYGSAAGTYQRIAAATDYDSDPAKFLPYFAFDGSNDSWATAAINFSATDKMTVFTGVTKLAAIGAAVIAELSSNSGTNAGAFGVFADFAIAGDYGFRSGGTAVAELSATGYDAPNTAVLTGVFNIAGPSLAARVNAVNKTTITTSQGTGNYGAAYPLYVGTRAGGVTVRFSGRIYALLVRGAQTSYEQIVAMERWVNNRTGAY